MNAPQAPSFAVTTTTAIRGDARRFAQSFDWRARQASHHPLKQLNDAAFAKVRSRLNQSIALA
jgi:hypothetical protein